MNELSLLDGSAPIDLGEFRELLQQELGNEDSRKAALQGLIEEIVAHPDYTMEVKYRIGKNDPVEPTPYPHEPRYAHQRDIVVLLLICRVVFPFHQEEGKEKNRVLGKVLELTQSKSIVEIRYMYQ